MVSSLIATALFNVKIPDEAKQNFISYLRYEALGAAGWLGLSVLALCASYSDDTLMRDKALTAGVLAFASIFALILFVSILLIRRVSAGRPTVISPTFFLISSYPPFYAFLAAIIIFNMGRPYQGIAVYALIAKVFFGIRNRLRFAKWIEPLRTEGLP